MAYLLDTNVFIEAKKHHYGFDFCPAFWDWIDLQFQAGTVYSIDNVLNELLAKEDDLSEWARNRNAGFFLKPDTQVTKSLRAVAHWANSSDYIQSAVHKFFSGADYFIVSHAHAHEHIVVTQEQPSLGSKRKLKIPDACNQLNIKWITPFKMLSFEKARFVL